MILLNECWFLKMGDPPPWISIIPKMEPPKSSISGRLGFSIINHPFGVPPFNWKPPNGHPVIHSPSIAGEEPWRLLAQDMKNNSRLEPVDVLFPGEDTTGPPNFVILLEL